MIESHRIAEMDEVLARCVQTVPGKLRAFFERLVTAGFSGAQALTLTQTFLAAVLAVPAQAELPKAAATPPR